MRAMETTQAILPFIIIIRPKSSEEEGKEEKKIEEAYQEVLRRVCG